MRAAEHAPRGPFYLLIRRHCLAEIVERGAAVLVERLGVIPPQPERVYITLSENTSRHGDRFAQQRLDFFEASLAIKGVRVVVGRSEGLFMFFAIDLQTSGVYVSLQL